MRVQCQWQPAGNGFLSMLRWGRTEVTQPFGPINLCRWESFRHGCWPVRQPSLMEPCRRSWLELVPFGLGGLYWRPPRSSRAQRLVFTVPCYLAREPEFRPLCSNSHHDGQYTYWTDRLHSILAELPCKKSLACHVLWRFLISPEILTWLFFALCIVAFAIRAYIRYVCFRRLFFEDYLILVALVLHSAEAVLIQIFVPILYDLEAVQNGDTSKIGPDFFSESRKGFISVGCGMLITLVGVLLVKLNFLFFFRRLGTNVQYFTILWWIVMLFTVAGTVAQIGTLLFGCFFGDVNYIFGQCATPENNRRVMINAIFSSVVDAVSDFFSESSLRSAITSQLSMCYSNEALDC